MSSGRCTNDIATMSVCLATNARSSMSFAVSAGRSRSVSGRLMPFSARSFAAPPATAVISTRRRSSATPRILPRILPSSKRIGSPTRTPTNTSGSVQRHEGRFLHAAVVVVNRVPAGHLAAHEVERVAGPQRDPLLDRGQRADGAFRDDPPLAPQRQARPRHHVRGRVRLAEAFAGAHFDHVQHALAVAGVDELDGVARLRLGEEIAVDRNRHARPRRRHARVRPAARARAGSRGRSCRGAAAISQPQAPARSARCAASVRRGRRTMRSACRSRARRGAGA